MATDGESDEETWGIEDAIIVEIEILKTSFEADMAEIKNNAENVKKGFEERITYIERQMATKAEIAKLQKTIKKGKDASSAHLEHLETTLRQNMEADFQDFEKQASTKFLLRKKG